MRKYFGNRYLQLVAIVAVLAMLHYIGAFQPAERLWTTLISSSSGAVSDTTRKVTFWNGWKDKDLLQSEIYTLRSRLQQNESSLAKLNALEKENNALKKAINWNNAKQNNAVIGKIIGKPINYPNTFIIINRGEKDGVSVGQPVYINEDIIIGKVESVTTDTSIVRLITDNQSKFSVRKSEGEEAIGLVNGKLGLSLELTLVPATEKLFPGDILVTSGRDPLIPEGFLVGSVDTMQNDSNEFFQSGILAISYDPDELAIVSVLLTR